MPCEPHPHRSNLQAADSLVCFYPIRSYLCKKNNENNTFHFLRLFKKQRETSQPLVAIKPKP